MRERTALPATGRDLPGHRDETRHACAVLLVSRAALAREVSLFDADQRRVQFNDADDEQRKDRPRPEKSHPDRLQEIAQIERIAGAVFASVVNIGAIVAILDYVLPQWGYSAYVGFIFSPDLSTMLFVLVALLAVGAVRALISLAQAVFASSA